MTRHLGRWGWPQINCTSSFNRGFTVLALFDLSFSSPINKAYNESMCNNHAIIINLKREDIAAQSCPILLSLGVVGAQICPHHKTSVIITQLCGAILPFVFNKWPSNWQLNLFEGVTFHSCWRIFVNWSQSKVWTKIGEMVYCPVFVLKLLSQGLHFYRAVKVTVGPGL